jgi:hypothetical protein
MKTWHRKSPLTGYVIKVTDGEDETFHTFENMWDAIAFMNAE